jgi:hypothetical protein
MLRENDLPYLIRLLDDETPEVRDHVISGLLSFGVDLNDELKRQEIRLSKKQQKIIDECYWPRLKAKKYGDRIEPSALYKVGGLVCHRRYGSRSYC